MSYFEYLKKHNEQLRILQDRKHRAFENRPLPVRWEIGQKVRFLRDSEWAWGAGGIAYVVGFRDDSKKKLAHEYQVFYTSPTLGKERGMWWTTPNDVELVVDK